MEDPFFFSIFLAPRLSFTYCSFHQQVVSVYVGTGGFRAFASSQRTSTGFMLLSPSAIEREQTR